METSILIIYEVLFDNILGKVYEVLVNVILKLHSNSFGMYISFFNKTWVTILGQFEVLSQIFTFHLQFANMVNVVIHSHQLLVISPLGYFPPKA